MLPRIEGQSGRPEWLLFGVPIDGNRDFRYVVPVDVFDVENERRLRLVELVEARRAIVAHERGTRGVATGAEGFARRLEFPLPTKRLQPACWRRRTDSSIRPLPRRMRRPVVPATASHAVTTARGALVIDTLS